ncbi:MAG: oligosaccharide repeat unit polymerase [Clostridium sp.]|nr:oligosaccharide repeat unit polymerase [Clostridium sp.]
MIVYFVCYVISFLLARQHFYVLSGLVLITAALWLYLKDYRRSGSLIHLRGLFCLFFVGGQGLSCFKLSRLQRDWAVETWVCLFVGTAAFWLIFEVLTRRLEGWTEKDMEPVYRYYASPDSPFQAGRILKAMGGLVVLSFLAFFFEAWKLGFVPLFSFGVPHAYSYFHVSGVHYFTVSCVLVPSLFVVYTLMSKHRGRGIFRDKSVWLGLLLTVLSLAVPVLCVSRFQLILAVGMAVFTYISMIGTFKLRYVGILMCCMAPAYVALTVMRSHSVEYLNGIFEMKNSSMPIFITQPYMYIANNYDNFNCLVEQLQTHAMGLRMLFPLWALTGLKFLYPALVTFPLFVTKEELTTVTLFYDAYYDFGILGMLLFGAALGGACCLLVRKRRRMACPAGHVFYAQIAMYMALSFFTTWFSNPATWFYLAVTAVVYFYVRS